MSAPPPEATGVAAATDELKALGIGVVERHCSGRVWPAALTLLEHLTRDDRCLPPGARVLELGAGTGYMALKATKRRPDVRWCATETAHEDAAERLASNLDAAVAAARAETDELHQRSPPGRGENVGSMSAGPPTDGFFFTRETEKEKTRRHKRVAASALEWSDAARSPLAREPWDVVVGSDLVYGEAGARDLATCLAAMLLPREEEGEDGISGDAETKQKRRKPFPSCFLAQTCGRWGGYGYDAALYRSLRAVGLRATAVGGESLSDSDEMRQHVCVFSVAPSLGGAEPGASEEEDEAHHPLLRAQRLRAAAEAAAEVGMSEDDRAAAEAEKAMQEAFLSQ